MFRASSFSSKTHRISPLALLPFAYHFTQAAAPTFKSETHPGAEAKDKQQSSRAFGWLSAVNIIFLLSLNKDREKNWVRAKMATDSQGKKSEVELRVDRLIYTRRLIFVAKI